MLVEKSLVRLLIFNKKCFRTILLINLSTGDEGSTLTSKHIDRCHRNHSVLDFFINKRETSHCLYRFYLAYGYLLVFMGIGLVMGGPIAGMTLHTLEVFINSLQHKNANIASFVLAVPI